MEKKSLMQEIADSLSSRDGFQRKSAEAFCRLFFDVIEEGLQRDKFVKIKGFGTFKLVPVSERESVNVNTGERIQIGSHTKVTFTPDAYIRDLVNKPFFHFQTTVLNDDTELEELEEANAMISTDDNLEEEEVESAAEQKENTTSEEEVAETTAEPTTSTDEPTESQDKDEDKSSEEARTTSEGEDSATPTSSVEEQSTEESEAASPEASTLSTSSQSAEALGRVEEGTTSEERIVAEESITPSAESSEPQTLSQEGESSQNEEDTPSDESETSSDESETSADEDETSSDEDETPSNATSGQQDKVRYIVEGGAMHRTPNWWKIIALFLFVLILMGLSYFAGYYKVFCPPCETHNKTAVAPAAQTNTKPIAQPVATDTTSAATRPQKPAKDSATTASKPAIASDAKAEKPRQYNHKLRYSIVGTREVHVIAKGENLYSIAAKAYGNKKFAPYIIRHNNLRNPDNIVIGARLKLPELALPDSVAVQP